MPKSAKKGRKKGAGKNKDARSGKGRSADPLIALRKEIDAIDGDLHRLIRRRAHLVTKVGKAKQDADAPVHRPAREAQILRKLVAKHKGEFPPVALIAIWREIIAASVRIQSDFRVAVPNRGAWLTALAREHFGSSTPYVASSNPLAALIQKRATVALLPPPGRSGAGLWWRHLTRPEYDDMRVLWRLPFAGDGRVAYVAGRGAAGRSGDDLTWLAVEMPMDASDPPGMQALAAHGGRRRAGAAGAPTALRLLEADGYISAADAARALPAGAAAGPVYWLGAFPRPLGVLESG